MKKLLILIMGIFFISCSTDNINAEEASFEFRDVATGFDTPWEILWGPDNYIWMTERFGRISRINPNNGEISVLFEIEEVFEDGERGLMGMALSPNFEENPFVYLAYNTGFDNNSTDIKLARFRYDGEKLTDQVVILQDIQGWWNHDGSRLAFMNDGTLLMTIGDAAKEDWAQDTTNLNGSIIRINPDGSVPEDNPFPGNPIFIYGSRNAQGLVIHNNIIYSSEHGPNTDDEVNIIQAGKNYGWPEVHGYCDKAFEQSFCENNEVIEPIAAWTPTLAVAGIDFYYHNLIPEWNNSVLVTSLKSGTLVQLKMAENGTEVLNEYRFFNGQFGRLRDICISPEGRVFIATSNRDGRGSPAAQDDRIIEVKPLANSVKTLKSSKFQVFPNPAKEEITFVNEGDNKVSVFIYDFLGQFIKTFEIIGNSYTWDLKNESGASCANGVYTAKILGSQTVAKTIVINR